MAGPNRATRLVITAAWAVLLPVPLVIVSSQPSFAAGTCTGPYASEFDGAYYAGTAYETLGTAAEIVTRPGTLCSGGSNPGVQTQFAWSMIASTTDDEWAQSGFLHSRAIDGGAYIQFAEYSTGNTGGYCGVNSPPAICEVYYGGYTYNGNNNLYYQFYWTGGPYPNCETYGCEVVVICTLGTAGCYAAQYTPFSPVNPCCGYSSWSQPLNNQFFGETQDPNTDMPGNNTDGWTTVSEMEYQYWGPPNPGWSGYDNAMWTNPQYSNTARSSHDTVVNHGGTLGNTFDIFCTLSCTP